MSQSMNTTAGTIGEVAPPSNNRWWAIAAGIGLAAVLGYGAAMVATDHLPGTSHPAAVPVAAVATPQVESFAGADDLATRSAAGSSGVVAHSALDPFEERSGAVSQAAVGPSGVVAHSARDPLEERLRSPEAQVATGTASASPGEITGSLSQPMVGYVDGQWHIDEASNKYPTPELR